MKGNGTMGSSMARANTSRKTDSSGSGTGKEGRGSSGSMTKIDNLFNF